MIQIENLPDVDRKQQPYIENILHQIFIYVTLS